MSDVETSRIPRPFSGTDARRTFIGVGILVVVAVCYWFALPAIQSLIIPSAPGGGNGPWVVRPILAFHFGAVAVLTSVTAALILQPLKKGWRYEDAALGTRYDPFHNRPVKRGLLLLQGFVLLAVYSSALVFYLLSWT